MIAYGELKKYGDEHTGTTSRQEEGHTAPSDGHGGIAR
jgi:hypothetical protein